MGKFFSALALLVCLASVSALCAQEITKPLGKWERKIGKTHVVLNIESHRLHISCTGDKTVTLHADYAMTRDGLIYGVVTSIECDEDEEPDMSRSLFDAPFSFRFRIDEGALIIHDMKAHDADSRDDMWNGRYKAVLPTAAPHAGTVPACYPTYLAEPWWVIPSASPSTAPLAPSPIAPSFSSPAGKCHK